MEEHKKKGLCNNCDEKFVSGHHCVTQKLYVLDENAPLEPPKESFEYVMVDIKEESDQLAKVIHEISWNSLFGFTSP